jgi:hypothetical protein
MRALMFLALAALLTASAVLWKRTCDAAPALAPVDRAALGAGLSEDQVAQMRRQLAYVENR